MADLKRGTPRSEVDKIVGVPRILDTRFFEMISRPTALLLTFAMLGIIVWAFLLLKTNVPLSEVGNELTNIPATAPAPSKPLPLRRPVFPDSSLPPTPAEEVLNRLEYEFYREFPLALKFRVYQNKEARNAAVEAFSERLKIYTDEPSDVRTKNLKSGNLNIIFELEGPLIIKQMLADDTELGEMLRVAFKAPRWDWRHMLRNLDSRLGGSASRRPGVETAEQLVIAIQEREERILEYCRKLQEEASMPDFIRDDIREMALEFLTRAVTEAYLETITPLEVKEARSRVSREAKERGQP